MPHMGHALPTGAIQIMTGVSLASAMPSVVITAIVVLISTASARGVRGPLAPLLAVGLLTMQAEVANAVAVARSSRIVARITGTPVLGVGRVPVQAPVPSPIQPPPPTQAQAVIFLGMRMPIGTE